MADFESALSELGAALSATDATLSSSLAEILGVAIQELIETELTAVIGAAHGERSPARTGLRNGHRPKLVSTPAGDIEVGIPKLREGSFFPELLEPRRRIDKALWAVIMTAYVTGTSTRKVDDLVKALGCESGVSKSTVSRICAGIDDEVAAFRGRPLNHIAMPYVYLDAVYIKARNNHRIVSRAVVVATAVTADGNREVLGLDVGARKGSVWKQVLCRFSMISRHRFQRYDLFLTTPRQRTNNQGDCGQGQAFSETHGRKLPLSRSDF